MFLSDQKILKNLLGDSAKLADAPLLNFDKMVSAVLPGAPENAHMLIAGPLTRWAALIAFLMCGAALLTSLWRLIRGPLVADRILAMDLATAALMAQLACGAWLISSPLMMDIALIVALLCFVATTVFANWLSRGQE